MTGVEHGAFGLKPTRIQPNINILGLSLSYIFMKTFTDSLKNVRKKIFLPEILKILILILTHSLDQSKKFQMTGLLKLLKWKEFLSKIVWN